MIILPFSKTFRISELRQKWQVTLFNIIQDRETVSEENPGFFLFKLINFYFIFNFYWKIIGLQYCAGFCHTSTWVSHRYTYVPCILNLPPISSPPHPTSVGFHRAVGWAPCVTQQIPLAICFTYDNAYVSMLLSQFIPPIPPVLCPRVCSLCLRLHCCPANGFIRTIFLDAIHMRSYTIFVFLFVTYFTLYNRL